MVTVCPLQKQRLPGIQFRRGEKPQVVYSAASERASLRESLFCRGQQLSSNNRLDDNWHDDRVSSTNHRRGYRSHGLATVPCAHRVQ